jgi:hypothetical protein
MGFLSYAPNLIIRRASILEKQFDLMGFPREAPHLIIR